MPEQKARGEQDAEAGSGVLDTFRELKDEMTDSELTQLRHMIGDEKNRRRIRARRRSNTSVWIVPALIAGGEQETEQERVRYHISDVESKEEAISTVAFKFLVVEVQADGVKRLPADADQTPIR